MSKIKTEEVVKFWTISDIHLIKNIK